MVQSHIVRIIDPTSFKMFISQALSAFVPPLILNPEQSTDEPAAAAKVKAAVAAPTLSTAPASQASLPARFTLIIAILADAGGVHVIAAFAVKLCALSTYITSPFAGGIARAPAIVCLASAHVVPLSALFPSTELT